MVGPALKVSAETSEMGTNLVRDFHFPEGRWCHIFEYDAHNGMPCFESQDTPVELKVSPHNQWIHLRPGYGIPYHDSASFNARNIHDLEQHPIEFHFNLRHMKTGETSYSWGGMLHYINDDGLSLETKNKINEYEVFAESESTISATTKMTLTFINKKTATAVTATGGCHAVNKNDYVNKIVFFGFDDFGFATGKPNKFDVYVGGEVKDYAKELSYDEKTKMYTLSLGADAEKRNGVCIQQIEKIELYNA